MWIPPLTLDDIPDTRATGAPWHIGLMVTQRRAALVAARLFPEEIATGTNCCAETGNEGSPCGFCDERNKSWENRIRQVRSALMEAFK